MDGAIRDFGLIREQEGNPSIVKRLVLAVVVTAALTAVVFGLTLAQNGADSEPPTFVGITNGVNHGAVPSTAPRVQASNLSFPNALATSAGAGRASLADTTAPEVVAAIASAAAELAHPEPVDFGGAANSQLPINEALPASVTATGSGDFIARLAEDDPVLRQAIQDGAAEQTQTHDRASAGMNGAYVLQVMSFATHALAEEFAEGLRERGHGAFVTEGQVPERGTVHRVRLGPFESMSAAQAYRRRFETEEGIAGIVLRGSPS